MKITFISSVVLSCFSISFFLFYTFVEFNLAKMVEYDAMSTGLLLLIAGLEWSYENL